MAAPNGPNTTQLGVGLAMRARDVSRPTALDEANAEQSVVVSYRPHGQPASRAQPPAGPSSGRSGSSPDAS